MGVENSRKTFVIVGGVAGGMSAATRLRRLNEFAEIIVIERSGYVSFANCGLPYYVGGVIEERESLLVQTPQTLAARFGIKVLINTEVTYIDPDRREVAIRRGEGLSSRLSYDELILAPGARPFIPPIPGIERALPLRDVEDTDKLVGEVAHARSAVVAGGGFIGVELAENLHRRGLRVAIVESADQLLAPLDPEMAQIVHERLVAEDIELYLGKKVVEVTE